MSDDNKKSFHIEEMKWDLSGFPGEKEKRPDRKVEINWSSVVETAKEKDLREYEDFIPPFASEKEEETPEEITERDLLAALNGTYDIELSTGDELDGEPEPEIIFEEESKSMPEVKPEIIPEETSAPIVETKLVEDSTVGEKKSAEDSKGTEVPQPAEKKDATPRWKSDTLSKMQERRRASSDEIKAEGFSYGESVFASARKGDIPEETESLDVEDIIEPIKKAGSIFYTGQDGADAHIEQEPAKKNLQYDKGNTFVVERVDLADAIQEIQVSEQVDDVEAPEDNLPPEGVSRKSKGAFPSLSVDALKDTLAGYRSAGRNVAQDKKKTLIAKDVKNIFGRDDKTIVVDSPEEYSEEFFDDGEIVEDIPLKERLFGGLFGKAKESNEEEVRKTFREEPKEKKKGSFLSRLFQVEEDDDFPIGDETTNRDGSSLTKATNRDGSSFAKEDEFDFNRHENKDDAAQGELFDTPVEETPKVEKAPTSVTRNTLSENAFRTMVKTPTQRHAESKLSRNTAVDDLARDIAEASKIGFTESATKEKDPKDKFYTFNHSLDEFRAMLAAEYEKVHQDVKSKDDTLMDIERRLEEKKAADRAEAAAREAERLAQAEEAARIAEEEAKKEAEQRAAEEEAARQQEIAEAAAKEAERAAQAEEARKIEEAEAVRKVEEARKIEEAEAVRKAEEARKIEEAEELATATEPEKIDSEATDEVKIEEEPTADAALDFEAEVAAVNQPVIIDQGEEGDVVEPPATDVLEVEGEAVTTDPNEDPESYEFEKKIRALEKELEEETKKVSAVPEYSFARAIPTRDVEAEAGRKARIVEAEAARKAAEEAEAARKAEEEAEAARKAEEEAEAARKAAEEAEAARKAEEEAEAARKAAEEAEAIRKAKIAEAAKEAPIGERLSRKAVARSTYVIPDGDTMSGTKTANASEEDLIPANAEAFHREVNQRAGLEEDSQEETVGLRSGKKKINYRDIFKGNGDRDFVEEKTGGAKFVILDVIIALLAIAVVLVAIVVFARGTALANKIQSLLPFGNNEVVEEETGTESTESGSVVEETTPEPSILAKTISEQLSKNANIDEVEEDTALVFTEGKDYGMEGVQYAAVFTDDNWYTTENGQTVRYLPELVGAAIEYYSKLEDKMNKGTDDVLEVLNPATSLYGEISAIVPEEGVTHEILKLQIGEVRREDSQFYMLVRVAEKASNQDDMEVSVKLLRLDASISKATVEEISTVQ